MSLELKNYDPALMQGANIGVSVDLTDITDMNGNEVIELDGVTSAVNYLRVANAATGNAVVLSGQGDDAAVGIQLSGKGAAPVALGQASCTGVMLFNDQPILDSASNEFLKFVKTSSAVNEFTVTNAATGNNPALSVTGGDTNISLQLTAKGTGTVKVGSIGTGTASSNAVTINAQRGVVTTESLTTAAGATQTITFTNSSAATTSVILLTWVGGTNTQGTPLFNCSPGNGSMDITIVNAHASAAFNGTFKISFVIL